MSFESDLRSYLIAPGSPVRALVTAGSVSRIYPVVLPQSVVYPCISYQGISLLEVRDLSGPSGKERPRLTINSWALDFAGSKQLAAAVKGRINGFRGMMGSTRVGSIRLDNSLDDFEEGAGPNGNGVYRVIQDYIIGHHNV